jgi:hypothetical protein
MTRMERQALISLIVIGPTGGRDRAFHTELSSRAKGRMMQAFEA